MLCDELISIAPVKNGTDHMRDGIEPLSRLSDLVSQRLGVDIVRGLYATGEALPTEMTLTKHWKVSRTSVREGICTLASKGLVETRTKAGTLVTDRAQWRLLDPLVLSWLRLAEPDELFIRSLFELRLILEPSAVGLAAKRRTANDLIVLSRLLESMSDPSRTEESARRAEIQFHRTLIFAAGNQTFLPLMDAIEAAVAWQNTYKIGRKISVRDSLRDHQNILDAVRRKDDAEARWLTEVMIRTTVELTIGRPSPRAA